MQKLIYLLILAIAIPILSFTHRPLTWVAIGDSITYLNDHPDETGNRVTKGYLSRVTEKLSYVQYINQGHNGWTSRKIADSIERLGIPRADVYSIFLGTNDWWQGHHVGFWKDYASGSGDTTIYGAFRMIIDKIRRLNPDASIVLITPLQRGDFVYINNAKNNAFGSYKDKDGQRLEQVVDAIRDIGEHEHFKVVDLYHDRHLSVSHTVRYKRLRDSATGEYRNYSYPDYTTIPFHPEVDEYPYPADAIGMTYDGLHPSDKGNAWIAKKLVKVLRKL
ncbi:SGNH/GDSL hydrolase family protein [Flavitalea sp. BT771]|uniref:SGNH/GDSL hydrolase family protein n=1 Tax=Flavitalea sp. BT771 TaxID=3063329 RepID=UPI0026E48AD1|nr:SGNH/GDSL hydrolase family protein [Flavitalea sp. BT771]MDO6432919.1 SGNH/GDSL hydrolase family protein [Flavitalea sp. BT771]MDV6221805.1 SGNH/GDSL hydrolase family protein [Flavitalea sp. BT771]